MNSYAILIGNTDNRLIQQEWASFVDDVRRCVERHALEVHFSGTSPGDSRRQNACFVASMESSAQEPLSKQLESLRVKYRQEGIAMVVGQTQYIGKPSDG